MNHKPNCLSPALTQVQASGSDLFAKSPVAGVTTLAQSYNVIDLGCNSDVILHCPHLFGGSAAAINITKHNCWLPAMISAPLPILHEFLYDYDGDKPLARSWARSLMPTRDSTVIAKAALQDIKRPVRHQVVAQYISQQRSPSSSARPRQRLKHLGLKRSGWGRVYPMIDGNWH